MKKILLALLSVITMISAVACSSGNNTAKDNGKINVYTTVFPIYDFTRNIGKDKININYVIPPGVEPHDYEITPKLMKDIQNADLLIKNGLGLDSFADKIKSENKLQIVDASEGIKPLTYDEEQNHEKENHESHNHGQYDPHVWLNVDLAMKECENIKNALIKADEKNKDYYEKNYNEYIEKLKKLKSNYDENLKDKKNKSIIVSHGAYGYLCDEYKINQISITGISPNQEPSLSKISEIANYAKKNNIKYILFDGLVNPNVAKTIADEANIKTTVLYSIDNISKKDFDNNKDYISLMNKNLETLNLVLK
ncbi:metal ABC transporter solute-binding protein, Zn/Mn family [Romboutsia sp. 1001216sp1]|uniref:metal ABC transporter solute-binding protein, Zn/Mn family n=1 Tax=Romboutsia sp. 1001216sp1 TaxID=2986997 RepID=UPI00232AB9AD|nr:zinc ABC transporter substrate-binding protein [Romboutsia sp. 1001216sp1]MDB8805604.1 zinc ABC transporter substrate-binding protein [Romboutsia sp. 1001216sp1]MDB8808640.1 zinc ABC transporter substrate-binding protein [Romboutsia sp. 1001216sp1]MDB8811079.1 zinc ABC transporter substrate-binding protein [Romboutsia sp. 1001216sp1]MDB8816799.1 zinc ABC transporter substrate-binding protein [Romboutsia sp. 1001216sp1]MDB8820078.1 zinc ABC transporter substrate-binding protein [Romboutsia s